MMPIHVTGRSKHNGEHDRQHDDKNDDDQQCSSNGSSSEIRLGLTRARAHSGQILVAHLRHGLIYSLVVHFRALQRAKVDYQRVDKAMAQMSDEDLARMGSRAREAKADFAAGAIGRTLLIVIILIIVLAIVLSVVF